MLMFRRKGPQEATADIGVQPNTLFNGFLSGSFDKIEAEREDGFLSIETESCSSDGLIVKTQYVYDKNSVLLEVVEATESAPVIKFTRAQEGQVEQTVNKEVSIKEALVTLLTKLRVDGVGPGSTVRVGTNTGILTGAQGKELIVKFDNMKQPVLVKTKGVRYFDKNDHLIGRS